MCVQGIHVLNVRRFPDPGKEFFLGNQGALLFDQVFQDLHSFGAQVSNPPPREHTLFLFVQADISITLYGEYNSMQLTNLLIESPGRISISALDGFS